MLARRPLKLANVTSEATSQLDGILADIQKLRAESTADPGYGYKTPAGQASGGPGPKPKTPRPKPPTRSR